jgi:hypothetical protein
MARLIDWEPRLSSYLAEVRDKPHEYGEHDCALHGANGVLAVQGVDHGAPFRGKYDSEKGAARALRRYGAGTVEATFDAHLPEIPVAFAQRGDLVMSDGAIGICLGGDAAFVGEIGTRQGLVRIPRSDWQKAWAVR